MVSAQAHLMIATGEVTGNGSGAPVPAISRRKLCWREGCGRRAVGAKDDTLRMKLRACANCRRAKYCSKLCQIFHWRSQHKLNCELLANLY